MFELALPWLLLALPLPLLMRWVPARKERDTALQVPFFQSMVSAGNSSVGGRRNRLRAALLWLIWSLTLLAAADPRWVGEARSQPYSGRDLMLAVDISESMRITDMLPPGVTQMQFQNNDYTRLQAIKHVVGNFAKRRSGDRLGLILFGERAYLQAPLTHDTATVNQLLREAQIGFAGAATAIGDAIGLAIKRLQDRPDSSRRLILLTDGKNTAGVTDPIEAARKAAEQNVKIYTIGFGAGEQIVQSAFGPRRINPSRQLDEQTLKAIAEITGGQYFRARSTEELEAVHQQLDALEPLELDELQVRPVRTLFYWPLGVALVLSALMALASLWASRPARRSGLSGGQS